MLFCTFPNAKTKNILELLVLFSSKLSAKNHALISAFWCSPYFWKKQKIFGARIFATNHIFDALFQGIFCHSAPQA